MTVAPRIPMARYSAFGSVTTCARGTKPPRTSATGGAASTIWIAKQAKMIASKATTNASSARKPRFISHSTRTTSIAVMIAPTSNGIPNSNLRAIAVPITSARSQAMIAASQMPHSPRLTGRE